MRKIFAIIISAIVMLSCFILAGCEKTTKDYYYDDPNISINGISVNVSCLESQYPNDNNNLTITLQIKNTETADKSFKLADVKVVNEKTNVKYNCSYMPSSSIILQYDIQHNFTITTKIPNSYKNDNYYLQFKYSKHTYKIKLYETPDELRSEHMVCIYLVSYKNGIGYNSSNCSYIKTLYVKDRRNLSKYIWENPNHIKYCDKWYTDFERTTEFNYQTKITENIDLYGYEYYNVQSTYDQATYITGINYVPQDGILVVDDYSGTINISNYGIYDNNDVQEIYLPQKINKIYFGNFKKMSNLTKIHFAGTESQWNSIESSSTIPETVTLVFNSDSPF